jgi:hypothetical protein
MEGLKASLFFEVKTYPNFQRTGIPLLQGKNLPKIFRGQAFFHCGSFLGFHKIVEEWSSKYTTLIRASSYIN